MSKPPFLQGGEAFKAGRPLEANPYPEKAKVSAEEYPGAHRNWRDGWLTAQAIRRYDEGRRKGEFYGKLTE
jgi:hypothetical protein